MSTSSGNRWYFISLGKAMGRDVFSVFANDKEFLSIPRKGADPHNKQLVRLYYPCVSSAPEMGVFHGVECPILSDDAAVKPVDWLAQALRTLLGVQNLDATNVPVILVLADRGFDGLMRGYQVWLNKQYMQKGALPIVSMVYTDEEASAESLMRLMELKEAEARYEQAYQRARQAAPAAGEAAPTPNFSAMPPVPQKLAPAPQGISFDETVITIVENYRSRIASNYIFFRPSIPPKKLATAIQTFAPEAVNETVLVLIDATVMGSAKEGGLITPRHFYARNAMIPVRRMDLSDIHSVSYVRKFPNYPLLINGGEFLQNPTVEGPAMLLITEMLDTIRIALHKPLAPVPPAIQNEKSPMEMIKELKDLLDIEAITQQEFDEKRQKYLEKI